MVVLLRGVNLGAANRIAMPELRAALAAAGFENARTYVQSGNIVLESDMDETALTEKVEELITEQFSLKVPALAVSAAELARVVEGNPLAELAEEDPKRFQVTFLRGSFEPGVVADRLSDLAAGGERVAVGEREIYAWYPDGVARSKLALKLGSKTGVGKGVIPTSRNWTTVLTLLEMATSDAE
jgi:uncharacterized protein (DUF1697 family)